MTERRILGLEALVRWDHPVLGTVPPDEFISLAEDDGLIVTLQRWVLQRAARDAAALLAGGWDVQMGVNVSVRHLQAGCLAPDVATALAASGLPPGKLILEITESVMLDAEDRPLRPGPAPRRPGGGNGRSSPYSGTRWLTSPAGKAHSVPVPRARTSVTGCPRSLVVA